MSADRASTPRPHVLVPQTTWEVEEVSYRYRAGDRWAVRDLSLSIAAGRCTAVLGPNGSGKSTLLRILLGRLAPDRGSVRLGGKEIAERSRRELARMIGVVPQDEDIAFPLTVRELVAMGRYAHLKALQPEGEADRRAVKEAMARCDVAGLGDRSIQQLSGGERQRARLARALAQEPGILALDEPTRALDIRHEMEILELLRELVTEGRTVVLVTHNINLAARYADHLVVLDGGKLVAAGPPPEVLQRELLEQVYRWPVTLTRHAGPGPDAGAIQVIPLARPESGRFDTPSSQEG